MIKGLIAALVAVFIMTGCGGGNTYVTEGNAAPEVPTDTGKALIITASDRAKVGMSYTEVGDGGILIDCGDAGCGDIYVGDVPEEEEEEAEEVESNESE